MDITTIQQNILNDDTFVLSETERIQQLLQLKYEIRWEQSRATDNLSESVAEHVYGMHILAKYFLPLEDEAGELDSARIFSMITWHDIDEVITGDIITSKKTGDTTDSDIALATILASMPVHMRSEAETALTEYSQQETREAQFVKAIDKAEPVFEMIRPGFDAVLKQIDRKAPELEKYVVAYVKNFPYILRFVDVNRFKAEAEGQFSN